MKKHYSMWWRLLLASALFCSASVSCDVEVEDADSEEESSNSNTVSSDAEVVSAFNYLNAIRENPSAYSDEVGYDLSSISSIQALNWNSILAKVAQQKAEDMVERGYFSHTDPDGYGINYYINAAGYTLNSSWYSNISSNYFESIAAGFDTGKRTVIQLVYDSGASNDNAGHRSALLGLSDWNKSCVDIGIGHAYGADTEYRHYWSFVIAKHDY